VTGLAEFSPFEILFSLGSVLTKLKNNPNVCATFSHGISYVLNLTKYWFGYTLGDFYFNASGHPEVELFFVEDEVA
jgi:hypothetical protein